MRGEGYVDGKLVAEADMSCIVVDRDPGGEPGSPLAV
jgi:hypothetical protein